MKTQTKTFMSGKRVKAQRYWKDASHWFKVVSENETITIYIDFFKKSASIDRYYSDRLNSILLDSLSKNYHGFAKSNKPEFEQAKKEALNIINKC